MQVALPYDTLVLHPGLYKQRILCEVPLKIVAASHLQPPVCHAEADSAAADTGQGSAPSPAAPAAAAAALASPQEPAQSGRDCASPVRTGIGVLTASARLRLAAHSKEPCTERMMPSAAPLSSAAVTLWQERPPVLLSNTDACCLVGVTVRVAHASHEYSSVAYGTEGRSIVMRQCHIMGGTGLRVPYHVDPLRVLLLNLQECVIQVCCLLQVFG